VIFSPDDGRVSSCFITAIFGKAIIFSFSNHYFIILYY
jgi:hypothetical protein